jgi:hypothetical protein
VVSPTVHYYPFRPSWVRPYVALTAGPAFVIRSAEASDINLRDSSVDLFVQPSVGTFIRFTKPGNVVPERDIGAGLLASVSWAFTTASFLDVSDLQYVGGQLGVFARY